MSYKMFKLISGEFVITSVVGEQESPITGSEIVCDTPFIVHFAAAPNGQLAINLFPLNPFASKTSEKVTLKKDHIIMFVDNINDQIIKQYVEITSGIMLAKENDVPPLQIER